MKKNNLFYKSENLSKDFNLFSSRDKDAVRKHVRGLVEYSQAIKEIKELRGLASDIYIDRVIGLLESTALPSAVNLVESIGQVSKVVHSGPFYSAVLQLRHEESYREVGVIAQDRSVASGVWMPEHHELATEQVIEFEKNGLAIVSFIDTPGADAGEVANMQNQAHSISKLIAVMGKLQVPNIGIIYGLGYSGGAIPLATSNINFALRGSAFSTIQPKGLSNIARRLNLSWERCAQIVGVSAYQLWESGIIEGVIDSSINDVSDSDTKENVCLAINSSLEYLERFCEDAVMRNSDIRDHYLSQVERLASPTKQAQKLRKKLVEKSGKIPYTSSKTNFPNIFGAGYRHLRYLSLRKKLTSIPKSQLGALSESTAPNNDSVQLDVSRNVDFIAWSQDSGKIIYQQVNFVKSWKKLKDSYQDTLSKRGKISTMIFGEPEQVYKKRLSTFAKNYTTELYIQWKAHAFKNFISLQSAHARDSFLDTLITTDMIAKPVEFAQGAARGLDPLPDIVSSWTKKSIALLKKHGLKKDENNSSNTEVTQLSQSIASELNSMILEGHLYSKLMEQLSPWITAAVKEEAKDSFSNVTCLVDVIGILPLREQLSNEINNLLLFDSFYDYFVSELGTIAIGGLKKNSINLATLRRLYEKAVDVALETNAKHIPDNETTKKNFDIYLQGLSHRFGRKFLDNVQEWKRSVYPRLSETLFVVITDILERILPSYLLANGDYAKYDGTFKPQRIGKVKDFWNRLTIAFQDLCISDLLGQVKKEHRIAPEVIIRKYFVDFKEIMADAVSNDPCSFPGFRNSIKKAIDNNQTPSGLVAGIGVHDNGSEKYRVGVVISNPQFQAGSFDMVSGEKFCQILSECQANNIPLIGFISSGGMQTKEGAGSLFSMAVVNDKLTRFVEDFDLPVILFGFGDCTGGAQASFVTHPKIFNYYFSGANVPFAGQIVVPSYLPYRSTLSNYLSQNKGTMQGLVRHSFAADIDERLKEIDPLIPLPQDSVEQVISRILLGDYYAQEANNNNGQVNGGESEATELQLSPVRKVLIHARGCTASKLIRIAQKEKIQVVLAQSDPDMDSSVAEQLNFDKGDTLVALGGNTSDESYLNGLSVILVAEREGVDSLHPGIGFLSENPDFAKLCRSHNINFIGPRVSSMEMMGNKSNAVNAAIKNDVPVVPGSYGILTDANQGVAIAKNIGYPVLIKAVHGGGGKGIKIVEKREDFIATYQQVSLEARSAFGSGELYLEKFVSSIRHIEAQILRDSKGNCKIIGIRDCSVQRDKQKVIEESDSTMLTDELRTLVIKSAEKLANAVDYLGAGTVEFIFDLTNHAIYFMEMNTRLQVEHPVTEKVSGIDIVAQQFNIASGRLIDKLKIKNNGYSIEVRVTAEKITKNSKGDYIFKADPGKVNTCVFPKDKHIDIIAAVSSGKTISPYYDSLIAQIIVHRKTRNEAINYLKEYLGKVEIKGVSTNIPLLINILADEVFIKGEYDTGFLEHFFSRVDAEEIAQKMGENSGAVAIDKTQIEIPESGELKVLSPSTGIFYSSASPLEPPYLNEGDMFTSNQTICLLEAMKVFSSLKLDDYQLAGKSIYDKGTTYEVTRVNFHSGQQVNAGDLLFVIKPTG